MTSPASPTHWSLPFLRPRDKDEDGAPGSRTALIILNQPFSRPLLCRLWNASDWHCCADGGANRLHDLLRLLSAEGGGGGGSAAAAAVATVATTSASTSTTTAATATTTTTATPADWLSDRIVPPQRATTSEIDDYLPDLIKGDLDSVRDDVRRYYEARGVPVVKDDDQDSTDLMKCLRSLQEKEEADGVDTPHDVVLLGGLSGRLDQTIHTLSLLHKLRKTGRRVFAVTDENVGWVLDEGKHRISIDHSIMGPTCGLLPVGVDSTVLTTTGLRWNLTNQMSGFDGLMSTSNHLVPEEDTVFVETSRPIWWVAELRRARIP